MEINKVDLNRLINNIQAVSSAPTIRIETAAYWKEAQRLWSDQFTTKDGKLYWLGVECAILNEYAPAPQLLSEDDMFVCQVGKPIKLIERDIK